MFHTTRILARLGARETCSIILKSDSRRSYVRMTTVKPCCFDGARGRKSGGLGGS